MDPKWSQGDHGALGTLSDLDKLNFGECSKYQLCSSVIDMTCLYAIFFMIQGDQKAPPQQPRQAQPWGVQQVPLMSKI